MSDLDHFSIRPPRIPLPALDILLQHYKPSSPNYGLTPWLKPFVLAAQGAPEAAQDAALQDALAYAKSHGQDLDGSGTYYHFMMEDLPKAIGVLGKAGLEAEAAAMCDLASQLSLDWALQRDMRRGRPLSDHFFMTGRQGGYPGDPVQIDLPPEAAKIAQRVVAQAERAATVRESLQTFVGNVSSIDGQVEDMREMAVDQFAELRSKNPFDDQTLSLFNATQRYLDGDLGAVDKWVDKAIDSPEVTENWQALSAVAALMVVVKNRLGQQVVTRAAKTFADEMEMGGANHHPGIDGTVVISYNNGPEQIVEVGGDDILGMYEALPVAKVMKEERSALLSLMQGSRGETGAELLIAAAARATGDQDVADASQKALREAIREAGRLDNGTVSQLLGRRAGSDAKEELRTERLKKAADSMAVALADLKVALPEAGFEALVAETKDIRRMPEVRDLAKADPEHSLFTGKMTTSAGVEVQVLEPVAQVAAKDVLTGA